VWLSFYVFGYAKARLACLYQDCRMQVKFEKVPVGGFDYGYGIVSSDRVVSRNAESSAGKFAAERRDALPPLLAQEACTELNRVCYNP